MKESKLKKLSQEKFDYLTLKHARVMKDGQFCLQSYNSFKWIVDELSKRNYDVSLFIREYRQYTDTHLNE